MKNKISLLILAAALCGTGSAALANGPADQFSVSLDQIDLCRDAALSDCITVFSGPSEVVDIAQVGGPGQAVQNFVSGITVPDGVYLGAKVTPSTAVAIKGSVSGLNTTADGGGACTVATAPSPEACTTTIIAGTVSYVFPTSVTVVGGTPDQRIRFSFELDNALKTLGGAVVPDSVAVGTGISVALTPN
jgi:hypothetical protein